MKIERYLLRIFWGGEIKSWHLIIFILSRWVNESSRETIKKQRPIVEVYIETNHHTPFMTIAKFNIHLKIIINNGYNQ